MTELSGGNGDGAAIVELERRAIFLPAKHELRVETRVRVATISAPQGPAEAQAVADIAAARETDR